MQYKWICPIAVLALALLQPTRSGGLKFIPIHEALTIRAHKSSPPHIAFEETLRSQKDLSDEWSSFQNIQSVELSAKNFPIPSKGRLFEERLPKIVLAEMTITKTPEIVYPARAVAQIQTNDLDQTADDHSWVQNLSPNEQRRLEIAQEKNRVLDQDWSQNSWSEEVQKVLLQNGALKTLASGANEFVNPSAPSNPRVIVKNPNPQEPGADPASVAFVNQQDEAKIISGPIEIVGGLAVTNEHFIEIRRSKEGVVQEVGRVDLQKGTYQIQVQDSSGQIVGRLVTKNGQILGEGRVRLSHLDIKLADKGPKLKIEPTPTPAGSIASLYSSGKSPAPPKTIATFLKGAHEIEIKKDGILPLESIARGSTTVVRAAAPNHLQTASIVIAENQFSTPLFPNSMIVALKEIVYNRKLDEESKKDLGGLIWGKVSLDGKPMPGIQVEVESQQGLQAIYFNQFMLPDPQLTSTSDNGLYAFVDVNDGFHSILALRGHSHFGYQNVVVESGSVALGDIENTMKNESVPLRVFGAFNGQSEAAQVTLQGVENDLDLTDGSDVVTLPLVARLGLARVVPANNEYVAARYLYKDNDEYIHFPLVSWSWLSNIKSYLKLDDAASAGIVVGFVHSDSFEAFVAGDEDYSARNIVYFDVQGRILQTGKGVAGGGFIMYNLPVDTHEIVTVGEKDGKVSSQVVPVDLNSLSVLSFRE